MAINFPNNPTNGQIYPYQGSNWVWDGTSWNVKTGAFETVQVTISVADWSGGTTIDKTVNGITPSNLVLVNPTPASYLTFTGYQIRATAQGTNSLTFTCTEVPLADVTLNISYFN
jgi:hypothetical protein